MQITKTSCNFFTYMLKNTTAMTTFNNDNQIVHFSKKFGLITPNQVILINGNQQSKIDINSIHTINLFKKRVFSSNLLLFLGGLLFLGVAYLSYIMNDRLMVYSTGAIGLIMTIYSLIHKFHTYRLVILEQNKIVHEVKATQIHRKCIKEFYSSIHHKIIKEKRRRKAMVN